MALKAKKKSLFGKSEDVKTESNDVYKDALKDIVEASDVLAADTLNRNKRIALSSAIAKAKDIL